MNKIPTPHNNAKKGEIAEIVLMPGDPLRAKYIAEQYMEEVVCYNTVRNMLGFTGTYKGKRISVQGSGMGMPSMGIYSYELYEFYDVKSIIRIGSAGGIADDVKLRDIVVGMGACTNSNYMMQYNLPGTYSPICSYEILSAVIRASESTGTPIRVGNIFSSDTFYDDGNTLKDWQKMKVLAVEMEAAALYANAARAGKQALAMFTISDCPFQSLATTAQERQEGFTQMMQLALESCMLI